MNTTTMRTTRAYDSTTERPKRHLLGLGMLPLTLSGGYFIAQRAVPNLEIVEEIDEDDAKPVPTLAEIMEQIDAVAARHHVSPRLVAAIIAVESEFNPRAVSRRGAQGLMQLMPATAAHLDVQDSFDTRENIEGGVKHLRVLMDRYHHDLPLVLAAYNAGDTAVLTHRGIPPYRETRQYVIRVLRRYDREAARRRPAADLWTRHDRSTRGDARSVEDAPDLVRGLGPAVPRDAGPGDDEHRRADPGGPGGPTPEGAPIRDSLRMAVTAPLVKGDDHDRA